MHLIYSSPNYLHGYNLTENITIALVDARINDEEFDLLIKLDKENGTYSLFLEDYITKYRFTHFIKYI